MNRLTFISLLITFVLPVTATGNDGFAELAVGGIVIGKTNDIALDKEVLDISYDNIVVNYEFINESDKDQDVLMLFPLPAYPANPAESWIISHGQPSGFSINMNGKSVDFRTEVVAKVKDKDVTRELLSAGLTEAQIIKFPFDNNLLGIKDHDIKLPKAQIDLMTEKGLLDDEYPAWDIYVKYIWHAKFPAKSRVYVEHSYRPFIAEGTASGFSPGMDLSRFCITPDQVKELNRLYNNNINLDAYNQIPGTIVAYVLTTANSWKDGIRDFTLRIHAKSKTEIVSVCLPFKVIKVSDTLYSLNIKKYKPGQDLIIYYGNIEKFPDSDYGVAPKTN